MSDRHEVLLRGVQPTPLTGYLKAIALLRLVAEQHDALAAAWWTDDGFMLRSTLDAAALQHFLLDAWAPTPLVAPWNGGSGFYPKDNAEGVNPISESDDVRFSAYRDAIQASRTALSNLGDDKPALLATLRATLPDDAIRWLDAAVVLGSDRPTYPPLLGTGGNDGRFEFSNTQMRRLVTLLLTPKQRIRSEQQLAHALFGTPSFGTSDPIGQFAPGRAGGANTGYGFDGDAPINPWDFVLALEGALMFAASTSRAFESGGDVAYPFFVRTTNAGFGSASPDETSRGEMWLPLWERPVSHGELALLIGEGRAWLQGRTARTADDFSRAIRRLGVARGISAFQRYIFAQRNGLSFLATPAGRYAVGSVAEPDPLASIDASLERVRRAAQKDGCPASVRDAWRSLTRHLLETGPTDQEQLLLALGTLSAAISRSRNAGALEFIQPIPESARGSWSFITASRDPAWEIARTLASAGIRTQFEPVVRNGKRLAWGDLVREAEVSPDVPAFERLRRVALRRLHDATPSYAFESAATVSWRSIEAILAGDVDEARLGAALQAAVLTSETSRAAHEGGARIPLQFALCAGALYRDALRHGDSSSPNIERDDSTPRLPIRMLELLIRGRGEDALIQAVRYLRAGNLPLISFPPLTMPAEVARRMAVALLLPLSWGTLRDIQRAICLDEDVFVASA